MFLSHLIHRRYPWRVSDPHYDDTSLALLFSQLKSKTLQTVKGTSETSGRREFNLVLQIARVFCRTGAFLIPLTHSSVFLEANDGSVRLPLSRLSYPCGGPREIVVFCSGTASTNMANTLLPPSPTSAHAFAAPFALAAGTRKESKILIDMDMLTEPPTRQASPELKDLDESEPKDSARASGRTKGESGSNELEHLEDEGDLLPRKAGLGSLIKNAKQNVQVPGFGF